MLSKILSISIVLFIASLSIAMAQEKKDAAGAQESKVHIVHCSPEGDDEDQETFNIRTLAAVLGPEEDAKDAIIYHYKSAARGFSAKLTPQQVEEFSKQPGVLQVQPSKTYKHH